MTVSLKNFIRAFELLTEAEKKEAVKEIIKHSLQFDISSLSDEELVLCAENLFLDLDKRELENDRINS